MDEIHIRYGEDVTLPIDAKDITAVAATLYVGKPGEIPVIILPTTLTDGVGNFELTSTDTKVPLDEYRYQVNIENDSGQIEKYPEPDCDDCPEDSFPSFTVHEALDETEVVS